MLDQGLVYVLKDMNFVLFDQVIDCLIEGIIFYLLEQIKVGVEVVKLFDSWVGLFKGVDFDKYLLDFIKKIIVVLKVMYLEMLIIVFLCGVGECYVGFVKVIGVDCVVFDDVVMVEWVVQNVQVDGCVQGNFKLFYMVIGGDDLVFEMCCICQVLLVGLYIFNLGYGIMLDVDLENVQFMIDIVCVG